METKIKDYAAKYNSPEYFEEDPIFFPKFFLKRVQEGTSTLKDVEIAGIIAAHLAWGRRSLIIRDCNRAFEEMGWEPYKYVMNGKYCNSTESLHRTIKWIDFATICANLKKFYSENESLEILSIDQIRTIIYGQKPDKNAANKKINMFRRWMVRNDGIIDLGIWKNTSPSSLIIPLDVHVHRVALELGLTTRKQADAKTALEITQALLKIFPEDPCLGDFALFAYGVSRNSSQDKNPNLQ